MAKELCAGHYQRKRIHGHALSGVPLRPSGKVPVMFSPCSVEDCDRTSRVAGRSLCGLHYQRWRKYGDATAPYTRNNRDQWTNEAGYILVRTGVNQREFEHRIVMAEIIGRPLEASENVHHLNGDRADTRPENLELWVKRQPPGQRVTDRVVDAVDLLRRYAPHLLAEGEGAPNL
jgi:hypothetical protein